MTEVPQQQLNDGRTIPQIGLGVFQVPADEAERTVRAALEIGYRYVDTAALYRNEEGVGAAVRDCPDWVFVTSKLWNSDQGYDRALQAFDASMGRLALETLDLYLIHWPVPSLGKFVETWKALVRLRDEGRVSSIGVSNFRVEDLERIISETGVAPATNQIELYPGFQQRALRDFHAQHGIVTTCWAPLGQGRALTNPALGQIAAKHGRTIAQIVLRWHVQNGLNVIPKSSKPARLAENLDVFGFTLDDADMAAIAGLDRVDGRLRGDPATFADGV